MTKSRVAFVLDDELIEVDLVEMNLPLTTTLLNYLRSLPDRKGTKEGCAEGDCGACTVVVAEAGPNGGMEYKACDSCLMFLPMIHGKQLITVESLKDKGVLHPVQEAMVNTDGSQCGYCTPGIVMSLFAGYKNRVSLEGDEIHDCLTGNLCRCTGYRPIVEAARMVFSQIDRDKFSDDENKNMDLLLNIRSDYDSLELISTDQSYYQPKTLKEAIELKSTKEKCTLVNGATDIGLLVTKQRQKLPCIIDLSAIEALRQIKETQEYVEYGAGLSLEVVKRNSYEPFPALYDMLKVFGSRQIRELATLGGNIANASPIGDTPPVLMAYDASVKVSGLEGERIIKLHDFITGYRTTSLKEDEIIISVVIPKRDVGHVKSYKISKRKDLDISTVSAGFSLKKDEANAVEEVKLFYGGMAAMITAATQTEDFLKGKKWERQVIETAQELLIQEFKPISDARSGAEGRTVMAKNLLLKFWSETREN